MHYRARVPESPEFDWQMYERFRIDFVDDFSEEVTELVSEYLGPGIEAYVTAEPGSFELWVMIAVAGHMVYGVYKVIGEYPQFREGLLRLISDMEQLYRSALLMA